ncbi:MAG: ABC transporter permease subunit [Chloroflexi bacterium]|nr:ABC transporter permease subunit [Chloroflexota bacterium]
MAAPSPSSQNRSSPLSLLRDERVLQVIGQIVFAIVLIALLYGLVASILSALASKNLTPNLWFLETRAGFDIGEKPVWYSASSTYWEAYVVGLINTLRIVVVGLVSTTVLGVLVGIFLLSTNWLLRTLSQVYVEILRNTPLLIQLFAWYFIVMLSLPTFQQSVSLPPEGIAILPLRTLIYAAAGLWVWSHMRRLSAQRHRRRRIYVWGWVALVVIAEAAVRLGLLVAGSAFRFGVQPWAHFNIRGFAFPEILATGRFADWMAFVAVGAGVALILWIYYGRLKESTGLRYPRTGYAISAIAIAAVVGWALVTSEPGPAAVTVTNADGAVVQIPVEEAREQELLTPQDELLVTSDPLIFKLPTKNNFRYLTGTQILPEYMALLLGLVVYTSAFIAEIVRAGIQAVPHGQVEAARALGLSTSDVLRLVVLPQALRVIIPPLGNQYLNLAKNSSLAIAVAYADLFQVTTTIMNQSGQSVTGMVMVMLTYLILSLIIAWMINRANSRFQLVTR